MFNTLFEQKLLPAVTLTDPDAALRLAEAYLEAGLKVMEVTFRTSAAAPAIAAVAKTYPEMHIGAGTVLSTQNLKTAKDAGAEFGLSPGFNQRITSQAAELNFPFIPGVITPSEIEMAYADGFNVLKLFPIKSMGGSDYLKALEGPYGRTDLQFILMGGVNQQNMKAFLEYESVLAVGGSWLSPASLIRQDKFAEITKVVRESIQAVVMQGKE
jgi:2-dehydro-3-deoxyphosphogluconate aldolase/(4S)-4-hydroxy-2-oxoglutarate aldolase